MFSAQDNNAQVPSVPVSPTSNSAVSQTQTASPYTPPSPPAMVSTTPTIALQGKGRYSNKLFFLIPIILLIGTMVAVTAILPSLRKATELNTLVTPTPSLTPATPAPTAKPNPVQGWKEYMNRDAQLSFRYPPTVSLKELKTNANVYTITLSEDSTASATIMKITSAKNTIAADLLTSQAEIDPNIKESEADIDVSGVTGKQTKSTLIATPAQSVLYTLVQQDTTSFNFVWYAPESNPEIYSQILATVRFVSPGVTPDWQTYTNTKGSYSLRFPPAWNLNTSDAKASASALTVSIRKNPSEAQFQNMVLQTTVVDAKTRIELSASEIVSSIQNLSGWKETPTLDFRTIGGAQAEVLSGEKDGTWSVYAVLWFKSTLVEISWRDTLLRQEQDNFNDILGSIRFK